MSDGRVLLESAQVGKQGAWGGKVISGKKSSEGGSGGVLPYINSCGPSGSMCHTPISSVHLLL